MKWVERFIHNDTSPFLFVIPGLTRNPVPSWIPAFAGMTECAVINVAVYSNGFLLVSNAFHYRGFFFLYLKRDAADEYAVLFFRSVLPGVS